MKNMYRIIHSYQRWSSGTVVQLIEQKKGGIAQVKHHATQTIFEIPMDHLQLKRDKSHA